MALHPTRHIGVAISRPAEDVYAFLSEPGNFPLWASGLGHSFRQLEGMKWAVQTPMGSMKVRFSERNAFGILDHTVIPEDGEPIYNPMRVLPNGNGSEVVFTLFQRPGVSDADFARDADWVARDLQALKTYLER